MHKSRRIARLAAILVSALSGLLASCAGTTGSSTSQTTNNPPQAAASNHVVVVLLENASYSEVIGSSSMPYFNSLARQYAVATSYFANAHPSLPNYFMLTAGELVTSDNNFSATVSDDNIVRELNRAGRSWKVYAEALPSVGYTGPDAPPYLRHHNPFVYFSDVVNDPTQQRNVVPFSQFAGDLSSGTLPDFSFVVPSQLDDAHTCPGANSNCTQADLLSSADHWLETNISPLLNSPVFGGSGLLLVLFDESSQSDLQNGGGQVAAVLAGPAVKRGYTSTTLYQHQSTLRMLLKRLGVTNYPNAAASAPEMDEFFTSP